MLLLAVAVQVTRLPVQHQPLLLSELRLHPASLLLLLLLSSKTCVDCQFHSVREC
jgi:hypothetical protein